MLLVVDLFMGVYMKMYITPWELEQLNEFSRAGRIEH